MQFNRRFLLAAGLGAAGVMPQAADAAAQQKRPHEPHHDGTAMAFLPREPGTRDQTSALTAAIERAVHHNVPLLLPPGRILVNQLRLPAGATVLGTAGRTTLVLAGRNARVTAQPGEAIRLSDLAIDGASSGRGGPHDGLLVLRDIVEVTLDRLRIHDSQTNGLRLVRCGGTVRDCQISNARFAGLFSLDGSGLTISENRINQCANNGILVWRTIVGDDHTHVRNNRIRHVKATNGGSGQNGNGVNVYRAGHVTVSGNDIAECAYSAIRGNAASNIVITGNTCRQIGEVALYAEFGFQGALIANNLVDHAATGIAVTNFNEGGRLAVVQGNLVRNLFRRPHEPQDKRGVGIAVEADASVSGNTIEDAPTAGLVIGWSRWMRDVVATGNVIRSVGIGIAVTGDMRAGRALIASNLISGAMKGAIRRMDHATPVGADLAGDDRLPPNLLVQANAVG